MKWDILASIIDKVEFVSLYYYEEEYDMNEMSHVLRSWLRFELVMLLGASCDDFESCYIVAYNICMDIVKRQYASFDRDNEIRRLNSRLLDNGDITKS